MNHLVLHFEECLLKCHSQSRKSALWYPYCFLLYSFQHSNLDAIQKLENGEKLHQEHFLKGRLKGLKECHLAYGQLLVWSVEGSVLKMLRIGTHHQLFGL